MKKGESRTTNEVGADKPEWVPVYLSELSAASTCRSHHATVRSSIGVQRTVALSQPRTEPGVPVASCDPWRDLLAASRARM